MKLLLVVFVALACAAGLQDLESVIQQLQDEPNKEGENPPAPPPEPPKPDEETKPEPDATPAPDEKPESPPTVTVPPPPPPQPTQPPTIPPTPATTSTQKPTIRPSIRLQCIKGGSGGKAQWGKPETKRCSDARRCFTIRALVNKNTMVWFYNCADEGMDNCPALHFNRIEFFGQDVTILNCHECSYNNCNKIKQEEVPPETPPPRPTQITRKPTPTGSQRPHPMPLPLMFPCYKGGTAGKVNWGGAPKSVNCTDAVKCLTIKAMSATGTETMFYNCAGEGMETCDNFGQSRGEHFDYDLRVISCAECNTPDCNVPQSLGPPTVLPPKMKKKPAAEVKGKGVEADYGVVVAPNVLALCFGLFAFAL